MEGFLNLSFQLTFFLHQYTAATENGLSLFWNENFLACLAFVVGLKIKETAHSEKYDHP